MLVLSRPGCSSACIEKIIELSLLVYRIAWSELGECILACGRKLVRFSEPEGHFGDFWEIPGVQLLRFFTQVSSGWKLVELHFL